MPLDDFDVATGGGRRLPPYDVAGGDGRGHLPEMERRVAALETGLQKVLQELAEMKGKLSTVPSAWQLVGINLALAVTVAGLVFTIARAAAPPTATAPQVIVVPPYQAPAPEAPKQP